tara:strand:- start:3714 stop:4727 length:1014 start_codon:yes stop_codon:yes gene_type:complete
MLLIAFGTRPEWIKIKPVVEVLRGVVDYKLLFTGQHKDLVEKYIFDYDDVIILSASDDSEINRLDQIAINTLSQLPEDMYGASHVVVQGDTTSALSVALAAFHRKIPVVHLEAGLRTYDPMHPYPEEFNRQAIGCIAKIHLCATIKAKKNLINEGKDSDNIHVVGNTVLDNLFGIQTSYTNNVLVTMHRRENHSSMAKWFVEINDLAEKNPELKFTLPLHPNPNVKKYMNILTNIDVVNPMSHKQLIKFLKSCKCVVTDSGGIQEEAAFFKKPCIVCREKTEREEGLGNFSWLCPSPKHLAEIFQSVKDFKINPELECPYGDGQSSQKILNILKGYL